MGTELFGRLVVGKAYANTKRLFADKIKDTFFGVVLALPGGLFSLYRYGLPVEMQSALNFAAATFGPIGFVVVVVFLWNLWLAPMELAYEQYKLTGTTNQPKPPLHQNQDVNWAPWKQMPKFSLLQFAKILAKNDPAKLAETSEAAAYRQLIWIAVNDKTLPFSLSACPRSSYCFT